MLRIQLVRVQHGVDQDFSVPELVPPPQRSNLEPLAGAREFTTLLPLSVVGTSANEYLE